jgi:hypothetical protein
MVTGRSMHLADGSLERLRRRLVDDIDVISCFLAGEPRGATVDTATTNTATVDTATECHDCVLFRLDLRNGDDDHHRRSG